MCIGGCARGGGGGGLGRDWALVLDNSNAGVSY